MIRSALMNVMTGAALKAGRSLKRDFGLTHPGLARKYSASRSMWPLMKMCAHNWCFR